VLWRTCTSACTHTLTQQTSPTTWHATEAGPLAYVHISMHTHSLTQHKHRLQHGTRQKQVLWRTCTSACTHTLSHNTHTLLISAKRARSSSSTAAHASRAASSAVGFPPAASSACGRACVRKVGCWHMYARAEAYSIKRPLSMQRVALPQPTHLHLHSHAHSHAYARTYTRTHTHTHASTAPRPGCWARQPICACCMLTSSSCKANSAGCALTSSCVRSPEHTRACAHTHTPAPAC